MCDRAVMEVFGAQAVEELGTGRLLVAAPSLLDPNFARTVILLLEHGDEGSLGLVLNRPAKVGVAEILPGWADPGDESVFHLGGPVSPSAAICLGRLRFPLSPVDGVAPLPESTAAVATVNLDADPALVIPALSHLRIFVGYAGWTASQLADEVVQGAWFVLPATYEDPFTPEPERLWSAVLARQGGALARMARMPGDPSLN